MSLFLSNKLRSTKGKVVYHLAVTPCNAKWIESVFFYQMYACLFALKKLYHASSCYYLPMDYIRYRCINCSPFWYRITIVHFHPVVVDTHCHPMTERLLNKVLVQKNHKEKMHLEMSSIHWLCELMKFL